MKFNAREDIKRILVVCLASVIMALNIKSFVRTGGLYPGGATGLALLIQRAVEMFFDLTLPYTLINILLNAIPIWIGFRFIGKKFTLYSCLMIVLTSVLTDMLPGYAITYDTLLISIFGGLINGCVISLCLMVNATSGGTDFIAIFLSERKGIDSWNMVLGLNVVILGVAGILFGWDKALYSIIFQFCSTQIVNYVHVRFKRMTLFIVTRSPDLVIEEIHSSTHHGVTRLEGIGTYYGEPRTVLYTVVETANVKGLVNRIHELDPTCFINVSKSEAIEGRFYQRPIE